MSWLDRFGEPLGSTRDEAAHYVQAELEQAVPKGWAVRCVEGNPLAWTIVKTDLRSGGRTNREYGVRLSMGLDFLFFTHGNTDAGPFDLHHALLRSLVIDAASVRHFGMAACLEHLMSQYEPNAWGYT